MANLCVLCQLSGGCMGCCGRDFISALKIKEALEINTDEFLAANLHCAEDMLRWRDREHRMDLRYGVCRNLILTVGQILCPLHPAQNNGRDLREGHCDINHFCQTAKEFNTWDKQKQDNFVQFILSKKLGNIEYSLGMDKDTWLKEFTALLEIKS